MPPAVHARWNETAWKSGGRKPLHRNFRAPHYTLPLGTFILFIFHLMNCLRCFPPAFQAPRTFALVLVSLGTGQKVRRRVGEHYDACINFILLNFNQCDSFDFATGLLFPQTGYVSTEFRVWGHCFILLWKYLQMMVVLWKIYMDACSNTRKKLPTRKDPSIFSNWINIICSSEDYAKLISISDMNCYACICNYILIGKEEYLFFPLLLSPSTSTEVKRVFLTGHQHPHRCIWRDVQSFKGRPLCIKLRCTFVLLLCASGNRSKFSPKIKKATKDRPFKRIKKSSFFLFTATRYLLKQLILF